MKITDVRTLHFQAEVGHPSPTPRDLLFVVVETDEGISGAGESAAVTLEAAVKGAVEWLKLFLIGEDPTRVEHLWQQMYRHLFWRGGTVMSAAVSAIDSALWDIAGKAAGVPVYKLLGGPVRDRIPVYTHADQAGTKVEHAVRDRDAGFFGIKTGADPDGPVSLRSLVDLTLGTLAEIRDAVGPDFGIMTDFHGRLTPPEAIRFLEGAKDLRLTWAEELIPPDNAAAYVTLAKAVPEVPCATGERLFYRWGFRELIESRAVPIIQPDVGVGGGISELRRIAAEAETQYIQLAPHNPMGPFNTVASIHLAAATPNFMVLEHARIYPHFQALVKEPLVLTDGHFELPTAPGLGIELDEEYIAAHPPKPRTIEDYGARHRRWYPDGSVADV